MILARAMEHARAAGAETSDCGSGKRTRINEDAGGFAARVLVVVGRGATIGIADAIRIFSMIGASIAHIRRGNVERNAGLKIHNAVKLPATYRIGQLAAIVHHQPTLANGQHVGEGARETGNSSSDAVRSAPGGGTTGHSRASACALARGSLNRATWVRAS